MCSIKMLILCFAGKRNRAGTKRIIPLSGEEPDFLILVMVKLSVLITVCLLCQCLPQVNTAAMMANNYLKLMWYGSIDSGQA